VPEEVKAQRLDLDHEDLANFVKNSKVWAIATCFDSLRGRITMADMPPHVSTVFKELFDELKSIKQQHRAWGFPHSCKATGFT
jgi:hypothetical protein